MKHKNLGQGMSKRSMCSQSVLRMCILKTHSIILRVSGSWHPPNLSKCTGIKKLGFVCHCMLANFTTASKHIIKKAIYLHCGHTKIGTLVTQNRVWSGCSPLFLHSVPLCLQGSQTLTGTSFTCSDS